MIYKPNSAYPNFETVAIDEESHGIYCSLQGYSSSKIYNRTKKTFYHGNGTDIYRGSSPSYFSQDSGCYKIEEWLSVSSFKNQPLTWQLRLYEADSFSNDSPESGKTLTEKDIFIGGDNSGSPTFRYDIGASDDAFICDSTYIPSSLIGYGTVQGTCTAYIPKNGYDYDSTNGVHLLSDATNAYSNYSLTMLKIFPHSIPNSFIWGKNSLNYTSTDDYTSGYDDQYSRYYIKIDNTYYKILDWRYYNWIDKIWSSGVYIDGNTDGYGNPLSLYVLIKNIDGTSLVGKDYTIYSNYIDTDTYSFDIITTPNLSFYDSKLSDVAIPSYDTQENAIASPTEINHSNLELACNITHYDGTYLSYYNTTAYILSNGKWSTIDKTQDTYSQNFNYAYDSFINGETYLLHIKVVDNKNLTYDRYICFKPSYGEPSKLLKAEVTFDKNEHCNIVDFSSAKSISAKETVYGNYEFVEHEEGEYYTHISNNNSLTYNELDGIKDLSITEPLTNIVVKLDSETIGTICTTTDDAGNTMILVWDGINFIYTVTNNDEKIIYPYYPYDYGIEDPLHLTTMLTNMEISDINTNIPYVWTEEFNEEIWNGDLYIHAEDAADSNWWSIVMCKTGICFKNLNKNGNWIKVDNLGVSEITISDANEVT